MNIKNLNEKLSKLIESKLTLKELAKKLEGIGFIYDGENSDSVPDDIGRIKNLYRLDNLEMEFITYPFEEINIYDINRNTENLKESADKTFFDELAETFTVEDFTGNIGVLLADEGDFEDDESYNKAVNKGLEWLEKLYEIACKHL